MSYKEVFKTENRPFPKDFIFGTASAACQIEGAAKDDGKGEGIWDALYKNHVIHNDNVSDSTDHYHHYKEDVQIMKEMGIKAYRFSISWPRVEPEEGKINEAGLQFYKNLVDELVNAGIEPYVTLYHWNLPMWLHEKGGFLSEEIVPAFEKFTKVIVDALSDKVSNWMTFNEPACFLGLGYFNGEHAPFESCENFTYASKKLRLETLTRNTLLAHGKMVRVIRENAKKTPTVGIVVNSDVSMPLDMGEDSEYGRKEYRGAFPGATYDASDAAIEKAYEKTFSENLDPSSQYWCANWFLDPIFLKKVPKGYEGYLSEEDLEIIGTPIDFLGYNCYNSVDYYDKDEYIGFNGMPRNACGWPITPDVLYWITKFFYKRYNMPVIMTENGMALRDFPHADGKVHDFDRIDYLKKYMSGLLKSIEEGTPVLGYFYWSILDNFEWALGYDMRFGLVYVDYITKKRIRKDSSYWYEDVIKNNAL